MSSSEDCTYELYQCDQGEMKRPFHIYTNSNIRQHAGKRRFPPAKKDQQELKKYSNKAKYQARKTNQGCNTEQAHLEIEGNNKFQINPIIKFNLNTTFTVEGQYHAVGQSQREKLIGISPTPFNFQQELRGAGLTTENQRKVMWVPSARGSTNTRNNQKQIGFENAYEISETFMIPEQLNKEKDIKREASASQGKNNQNNQFQ